MQFLGHRIRFSHPEVLFPGQHVTDKQREFCVEGKRIDLLFHIDTIRHIVELKAVPLTREHVGQIAEYYGLMRTRYRDGEFKLTLVAPSIPTYRSTLLEEIGIRCVEVPENTNLTGAFARSRKANYTASKARK